MSHSGRNTDDKTMKSVSLVSKEFQLFSNNEVFIVIRSQFSNMLVRLKNLVFLNISGSNGKILALCIIKRCKDFRAIFQY